MKASMHCPYCAAEVQAEDRFCTNCAKPLPRPQPARAIEASAEPQLPSLHAAAPDRSLREMYFELGLKLTEEGRAAEALGALESAQREAGDRPQQADLLLAAGLAAQLADRGDQSVRYLLETALIDPSARRKEIVEHVLIALTASSALSNGRWVVEQWWPRFRSLTLTSDETLRAQLLIARVELFVANFEQAMGLLKAAAQSEPVLTRAELRRMLAPEHLPPSLSETSTEVALVLARLWRSVGDPAGALESLDQSLSTISGDNYPDAPLHALRSDLLLELGDTAGAASSLHQAGDRYLWRREPAEAVRLLEQAIALAPEDVAVRWSLADALLLASYETKLSSPERVELVRRGRAAWDSAYAMRPPDKSEAWTYATRAYLVARDAEVAAVPSREPAQWQAVTMIERALLLTPENPTRWGDLSSFHRGLMNQHMAVAAALHGQELEPTAWSPLSELVVILTNTGRWQEATAKLAELESQKKTPWTALTASRLHLYCERKEAALQRIDEALQQEPTNIGFLSTRALVLRRMQRYDDSRAVQQAILGRFDLEDRENLIYFGWAALECGERERALQTCEADLKFAGDDFARDVCLRNLAYARLANDDVAGAREAFADGISHAIDAEGRWLILDDLDAVPDFAESWGGRERVEPVMAEFRRRFDGRPQLGAHSAEAELEAALASAKDSVWQTVGATAGLARLECERGDFAAAAQRYADLERRWPQELPQAPLGIDRALEGLQQSLSVSEYWALRDRVKVPSPWQQRLFESYLDTHFKLAAAAADSAGRIAFVAPIAVELGAALIPSIEFQEWPIVTTYLPAMRERIERETGVNVPGTRLRSNEEGLSPNRLLILLGEVPLATWAVEPGGVYCLADGERVEALGVPVLHRVSDPLAGTPACWVDAEHTARVRAAGIEVVDDHHACGVRLLEAVTRRNLADFVGVDEVEVLLERWREKFGRVETIDRLLGDDTDLLSFTRLLRRLARERVSIADGAAILDAVAEHGLADAAATLRAVRASLRNELVGGTQRPVRIDPALEDSCLKWLQQIDGKTFFAPPPEEVQEIVSSVRTLVAKTEPPPVLVVGSASLRPHLRDLLQMELPDVVVLAADELAAVRAKEAVAS